MKFAQFLVFILILFLCLSPVEAGDALWPLPDVVNSVLAHNAGLQAADAQVRQNEAALREVKYQRLPSLSAQSTFSRGDQPVYAFGSLLNQGRFGASDFAIDQLNHPSDLNNIQSSLSLGVPLFTGFELTSAAQMADLGAQQARTEETGRTLQLRAQASMLYLQLLLDDALLQNLDQRLTASAEELKDATRLKDRGLVLGSDYYAAESIFGGLQGWKNQVQTDRTVTLARLTILSKKEGWQPQGALTEKSYDIPTQAQLIEIALTKRPDLLAAASQISMAEVSREQANHKVLPRVQAFVALETDTNDFNYNPSNHLFGVSAQLPFGDPSYFARKEKASFSEEAARRSRESLEEQTRLDVSQAYTTYQGTLTSQPIAKETLQRATQSLDLFRPLYRSGRQSILDVLRAEEGLAKARAAFDQSLFQLHIAYLQLMSAAGSFDDRAVQELAHHLEPGS